MKVLICDDKEHDCNAAVESINGLEISDLQVESKCSGDLTNTLGEFFKEIKNQNARLPVRSIFDDYDIVLLDNNLSALEISGARLTAEAIAGYIRAYSKATYIISLNKNPDVDFDLRYLVGDYSTIADLALNTPHLQNKALWTGNLDDADSGFKPWYWPTLLSEPTRRSEQIRFVKANFDAPVFEALGFDSELTHYISRHAIGTLSQDALYQATDANDSATSVWPDEITFVQFFLGRSRSLASKDERALIGAYSSENGGDLSSGGLEIVSRVVAADIDLWFRRDPIAPQDALVDVPHLLLRLPFLLGSRVDEIEAWNDTIAKPDPPFALGQDIDDGFLHTARLVHSMWSPSPAFFWPRLRDAPYRSEFDRASTTTPADVVFCEDVSKFVYRKPAGGPDVVPFEAEFEGSWSRRYVARVVQKNYAPRSRFAL